MKRRPHHTQVKQSGKAIGGGTLYRVTTYGHTVGTINHTMGLWIAQPANLTTKFSVHRSKADAVHALIGFKSNQATARPKKWIQGALKYHHKGSLHKQLHVPTRKKIPLTTLQAAARKPGLLGQRARLALTLRKIRARKQHKRLNSDCCPIGTSVRLNVQTRSGVRVPGTWIVVGRQGGRVIVRHHSGTILAVPQWAAVRSNPSASSAEVQRARAAYEAFHWGTQARQTKPVRVPAPRGPLMEIGKLHSVAYTTTKGREGRGTWEHEFGEGGGRKPILAADRTGRLHVIGGSYRIRPEGITG